MSNQLGLFDVLSVYDDEPLANPQLYHRLQEAFDLHEDQVMATTRPDRSGREYSDFKRRTRWLQQSLKMSGLLERVGPGSWQRTGKKSEFTKLIGQSVVLAYSTDLGCALWGDITATAELIDEPIQLYFSSPPYPLAKERSYGNVAERHYVDWLCESLAPVIKRLANGGSLVLNLSNDIFGKGSPHRSSYLARLTVKLEDTFKLYLMDCFPWISNKAPGPYHWAQKKSVQLHGRFEWLLWLTPNPDAVSSDNRRITQSEGLPGNVWEISNTCKLNRQLRHRCQSLGLPVHDAMYPANLAFRAVEFWTSPGQLVVDLMSGSNTLGFAAEALGRRWICADQYGQFVAGGAQRWQGKQSSLTVNEEFLKYV